MEIDPDYAPAAALAAWCHAQLVMHNGAPSPGQERTHALLPSERAGLLDPDDPLVLAARSAVHTMAGHFDYADELVGRALALDPTFVWAWDRRGWLNAFRGEPEAAIEDFDRATRLDSRPQSGIRLIGIGCAHFDAGRYKQAASVETKRIAATTGHSVDQPDLISVVCSRGRKKLGSRFSRCTSPLFCRFDDRPNHSGHSLQAILSGWRRRRIEGLGIAGMIGVAQNFIDKC
jgi:tetratricopeptide (TPR) repeat protein